MLHVFLLVPLLPVTCSDLKKNKNKHPGAISPQHTEAHPQFQQYLLINQDLNHHRSSRCEGTLEVKQHEEWHEVVGIVWTLKAAAVLYSVRLVQGSSLCSGRLEVRSNQSWSSVCEDDLDHNDTEVICRELGCGAPSPLQGALYGEGEAPVWTSEFQCDGNESALLDCRRSNSTGKTCSTGKAAELTCRRGVRLVGGASRCAGNLEVKLQDEIWRPVDGFYWNLRSANRTCADLDCGSAVSIRIRDEGSDRDVWRIRPECDESSLKNCFRSQTMKSSSSLELNCSGRISNNVSTDQHRKTKLTDIQCGDTWMQLRINE
uniref:SRCR domain-containing protein n=1 Tax=Sphaeramia orbicularis TaxID=375764 RepID=A0A673CSE3_9TELE